MNLDQKRVIEKISDKLHQLNKIAQSTVHEEKYFENLLVISEGLCDIADTIINEIEAHNL